MLTLLTTLQTRMRAALVPAIVGQVYLGIAGQERQALLSDYDLLIIDDGGEDPVRGEHPSSTEIRLRHVIYEMLVRATDIDISLSRLLTKWAALETEILAETNKVIYVGANRITDAVDQWFTVESGLIGNEDMPTWRYRRAVVDYRVPVRRGGQHPY